MNLIDSLVQLITRKVSDEEIKRIEYQNEDKEWKELKKDIQRLREERQRLLQNECMYQ